MKKITEIIDVAHAKLYSNQGHQTSKQLQLSSNFGTHLIWIVKILCLIITNQTILDSSEFRTNRFGNILYHKNIANL